MLPTRLSLMSSPARAAWLGLLAAALLGVACSRSPHAASGAGGTHAGTGGHGAGGGQPDASDQPDADQPDADAGISAEQSLRLTTGNFVFMAGDLPCAAGQTPPLANCYESDPA